MNRNTTLYNACIGLIQVSRLVRFIDEEYAKELINKAQEYKDQIVPVDKETESEIKDYARRIKE